MARLVEVKNSDDTSTFIAILDEDDDVEAVSRLGDAAVKLAGKAQAGLATMLSSAVGMASSVREALDGSPVQTATLEVGLQLTANGTVYVVGGEAQSAMKLSLTIAGPGPTT